MTIRAGTLVTRYTLLDRDNPCLDHVNWGQTDHDPGLDVCLGLVIECIEGQTDVVVQWLQMCPYAKKEGQITQEVIDYHLLWEVGQLLT